MSNHLSLPLIRKLVGACERIVWGVAMLSKDRKCIRNTKHTQVPADLGRWFWQRVIGINAGAYWPMHRSSTVSYARHVRIGIETSPGWSPGCMIHGVNGITIGDYTQISQNVALLSGNHDPYCLPDQLSEKPIHIGKYCLLGFNSVVMPGVSLGDYTIVGANAVVTKSYPDGYIVLAGAPAKPIKYLNPELARNHESPPSARYHGYIAATDFPTFAKKNLMV